ncbi:GNAT family N-acetyltransferase [Streptomyces sp. NPDC048290]|uniref:GNAT family N-acetyltransferase n=1 Tax=Streptomyces sp. NPDC048290 TaxID=3155811 RepID=UPI003444E40C
MFRLVAEIDPSRRAELGARLRAANTAASPALRALRAAGQDREAPLQLWALDDTDALVGGLAGHTWAGWLHVSTLWVDERWRGGGVGGALLSEAERVARAERGCRAVRLETWDFQAPEFYRKQGYDVVCVIPDYPVGITEYTFTKRL